MRRRRKRPAVAIPRPSCPNNRTRPLRCRSEHIPLENSARVLLALVLRSRFCVVCVSVVPLILSLEFQVLPPPVQRHSPRHVSVTVLQRLACLSSGGLPFLYEYCLTAVVNRREENQACVDLFGVFALCLSSCEGWTIINATRD